MKSDISGNFIRWSGLAAMVGGALWIVTIVITAFKPEHPMRGPGAFTVLLLLALPLIGLGVAGIYVSHRKSSGRTGKVAAAVTASGIAIMVPGRLIEPAYFFQAGLAIFLVGLCLLVASVFMAKVLPRSAALALVIGTLALPLFNFGNDTIWIGSLLGAAWIWLGVSLRSLAGKSSAGRAVTRE